MLLLRGRVDFAIMKFFKANFQVMKCFVAICGVMKIFIHLQWEVFRALKWGHEMGQFLGGSTPISYKRPVPHHSGFLPTIMHSNQPANLPTCQPANQPTFRELKYTSYQATWYYHFDFYK